MAAPPLPRADNPSNSTDTTPSVVPTRERILDVAEALFAERGLAGASVRDIAAEAGLTAPSLYNHFEGKQMLYEAVLARGVGPLIELLEHLAGAPPELDRIDGAMEMIMNHLSDHPHLARLIHHEALTGGANLARVSRSWIRPLVQQGLAVMKHEPGSPWTEDEAPLVVAAWVHIILGHFALAPMMREVFDDDPLSARNLARQTAFLRKLARLTMAGRQDD